MPQILYAMPLWRPAVMARQIISGIMGFWPLSEKVKNHLKEPVKHTVQEVILERGRRKLPKITERHESGPVYHWNQTQVENSRK